MTHVDISRGNLSTSLVSTSTFSSLLGKYFHDMYFITSECAGARDNNLLLAGKAPNGEALRQKYYSPSHQKVTTFRIVAAYSFSDRVSRNKILSSPKSDKSPIILRSLTTRT